MFGCLVFGVSFWTCPHMSSIFEMMIPNDIFCFFDEVKAPLWNLTPIWHPQAASEIQTGLRISPYSTRQDRSGREKLNLLEARSCHSVGVRGVGRSGSVGCLFHFWTDLAIFEANDLAETHLPPGLSGALKRRSQGETGDDSKYFPMG